MLGQPHNCASVDYVSSHTTSRQTEGVHMKAIVFDRFGGTEVLHQADIEVPQPGPGRVGVRVQAAGLNAVDGKIRSGMREAVRPATSPAVPGGELAGVVDALGEGVSGLRLGD